MLRHSDVIKVGAIILAATSHVAGQASPRLGTPLTQEELRELRPTVLVDGSGLPQGRGTVTEGSEIYKEKCESCHAAHGKGGIGGIPALSGGIGTLRSSAPVKTLISYWPFATTAFDYIRKTMPLQAPNTLTDDEAYALVAYLLSIDDVVPKSFVADEQSLPKIRMPNRDGFDSRWPPSDAPKSKR